MDEKKEILDKLALDQNTKIAAEQILTIYSSFKSKYPEVNFIFFCGFNVTKKVVSIFILDESIILNFLLSDLPKCWGGRVKMQDNETF